MFDNFSFASLYFFKLFVISNFVKHIENPSIPIPIEAVKNRLKDIENQLLARVHEW